MTGPGPTPAARPGGPAVVRVLDELVVSSLCVGPMENTAYLLTCRASGTQLLVDAADEADRLLALVRASGDGLATVVTTHRHRDHVGALAAVTAATGADLLVGSDDADAVVASTGVTPRRRLVHGDAVICGHVTLDVVALRGHTPGSVALAYREPGDAREPDAVAGRAHLFTGDSLFPGGPGRTTSRADFTQLMDDLEERVFARFDDRTLVHPGHGAGTVLGAERPRLGEWRARGW
ncbi:glyoxylase-like metal-dependent hydrolase (beta-lactamase superfamily II) [Sediminihabitans luteus]|uniref:Glyoxylase-like metal-dependent hydrolase (Beta-lactamase superfamily II) n=1 Tax=Sediminihabitans luteus TaxID=1138585 RepID=A0A2M9CQY1_9CELL|nr:MBL fold metallo-hydrolase [Sediminihabitans luteus]PJJ74314.1 glyoxylase-like metal-dependent hydrolase (beta-lactamase superfamily II) [Sediminihabitans luteus]GII99167.1 hypothetical protein Slu03_15450 [Sediminihabitans luteus]